MRIINVRAIHCLTGVGLASAIALHTALPAQAHGASVDVRPDSLTLQATYETGEPMANAQVAVYTPADPETPWETGQTNANGEYQFSPDAAIEGNWEVTVRQAGHGQTTTFWVGELNQAAANLDSDTASSAAASGIPDANAPSTPKWVTLAAIVWGFIGTALYFSARSKQGQPPSSGGSSMRSQSAERTTERTEAELDMVGGKR